MKSSFLPPSTCAVTAPPDCAPPAQWSMIGGSGQILKFNFFGLNHFITSLMNRFWDVFKFFFTFGLHRPFSKLQKIAFYYVK